MAVIEIQVRQFFAMTQNEPPTIPDYASASQFYNMIQTAESHRKVGLGASKYSIAQSVNYRRSITHVTVNDFFTMFSSGGKGDHKTVTDFFFMWQNARTVLFEQVSQTFIFSDIATFYRNHGPIQTFTINQIVSANIVKNIVVVQTYSPVSKGYTYKPDKNFIGIVSPVLGGPNGTPEYVF